MHVHYSAPNYTEVRLRCSQGVTINTYLILFTVIYLYILKIPLDGAKVRRKGVSYFFFIYVTYFLLYFHGANELNNKIEENVFARAHKKFEHSWHTEINFTILLHTRRQNETHSHPQNEWPITTLFPAEQ